VRIGFGGSMTGGLRAPRRPARFRVARPTAPLGNGPRSAIPRLEEKSLPGSFSTLDTCTYVYYNEERDIQFPIAQAPPELFEGMPDDGRSLTNYYRPDTILPHAIGRRRSCSRCARLRSHEAGLVGSREESDSEWTMKRPKPSFFRVFLQITVTSILPREGKSRSMDQKILGNSTPRLRDPAPHCHLKRQIALRTVFRSDTSSSRGAQLTCGQ